MAVEEGKEISLKDFANKCFEGGKGKALIGRLLMYLQHLHHHLWQVLRKLM